MRASVCRRGYALVLVLVFLTLLLSLSGLAFRYIGAALRLESVRAEQALRDEGSLHALARALALLQTGTPPANPYECGLAIDTSAGSREYIVTFSAEDETTWSVSATPADHTLGLDPMPNSFETL